MADASERGELVDLFAGLDPDAGSIVEQLASACGRGLGVDGCGVSLLRDDDLHGSIGCSGAVARRGERLQFDLGEGPGIEAARTHRRVAEPHLASNGATRWLAWGPAALEAGIAAVFAAPMGVGAARIGALTAYQTSAGPLAPQQFDDLGALGEIATDVVLSLQSGVDPGSLADELAAPRAYHPEVHQATGVISAQMDIDVADAIVVLRARAYAEGTSLRTMADDVIARRIRFEPG